MSVPQGSAPRPGTHYAINDEVLCEHHDYVVLPNTEALARQLRHEWVLRRAFRPFVPQPDSTPLPDTARTHEERAHRYCVYLRPWVLARQDATVAVPHNTDLNVISARHLCARTRCADDAEIPLVLHRVTKNRLRE